MRTVKEIATDLEVTIQTIYNHIKKNEKELQGCIFKQQNTTVINDEGIRIIKESMGLIQVPVKREVGIEEVIKDISDLVSENVSNLVTEKVSEIISAQVKQEMDKLEQEIQDLKEQNRILIELMQEQKQKKSIFNWFKG